MPPSSGTGSITTIAAAAADLASGRITAASLLAGVRSPRRPKPYLCANPSCVDKHHARVHDCTRRCQRGALCSAGRTTHGEHPILASLPPSDCTRHLESARPLNAYITETLDAAAAAAAASDQRRAKGEVRRRPSA